MIRRLLLLPLVGVLALGACTEEEIYGFAEDARVEQCSREAIADQAACEANARISYDEAQKKHAAAMDPRPSP